MPSKRTYGRIQALCSRCGYCIKDFSTDDKRAKNGIVCKKCKKKLKKGTKE